MLVYLLAFLSGAIYDAVNVGFIDKVAQRQPAMAGLFSVLVGACALAGILGSVHSLATIPFLLAGYFTGTYCVVWWQRRRAQKEANDIAEAVVAKIRKTSPHLIPGGLDAVGSPVAPGEASPRMWLSDALPKPER